MDDIKVFDVNMVVETNIARESLTFKNSVLPPFKVHGLMRDSVFENSRVAWTRMPDSISKEVSNQVYSHSKITAGGRIRFCTDSPYVAINVKMPNRGFMSQLTPIAMAGFDLYVGNDYYNTFIPPITTNQTGGFESVIDFPSEEMREITINFPLYFCVDEVFVGTKEGCNITAAPDYLDIKPIVYYGSSITMGGCANRPGNTYESIIARETNVDYINLGFAGAAKGEPKMAEYIATLDMSMFVLDYDYNANTPEQLDDTHEAFFKTVRKAHPDIPVLIMSRPVFFPKPEEIIRRDIVKKTYDNAVAAGDNNVYFIDGTTLLDECRNDGTVDGIHPTDYGFHCFAKKVLPVVKKALGL